MLTKSTLIPIYLGITGHRDILESDKPKLKQLIKAVIEEKKKQCPNTPVVILTPLAEGADCLAAQAALECGIPFVVPLPMPVDEYRKDFTNSTTLNEFNSLLEKAKNWFELPLTNGISVKDLQDSYEKRNDQYFEMGMFISRNSHLLVALWDGVHSNKHGGTSHVVDLKKSGLPSTESNGNKILRYLQTGSIYHIVTPRKSNPNPEDAFAVRMIYPDYQWNDSSRPEEIDSQLLSHIESLNKDIVELTPKLKSRIDQSEKYLYKDNDVVYNNPELSCIARIFAITDILSTYFQQKRYFALKVLLTLVVLAFLFFQIYVEFWHKPLMLLLYPLTMGIGALWFLNAHQKRYEQKHEDYRALSEAFRVQFFLLLAGKFTNVADHYLQKHKGELEWVIYVLRAYLLKTSANIGPDLKGSNNLGREELNFIKANWVEDQLIYYKKTNKKYHITYEKLEKLANGFFLSALSAASFLFLFTIFQEKLPETVQNFEGVIHSCLVVCTHSFLVISGAIHGYIEKMIFAEQAKTFHHMSQIFYIANEKLGQEIESLNYSNAAGIILELGLESLVENADWLILHRSRPMEIPKG